MKILLPLFASVVAAGWCASPPDVLAGPQDAPSIESILEAIRAKSELPSLAAAVVVGDAILVSGATGVRKLGDATPVTGEDKYHLGSCTKPFTATLTALLIEEGQLTWQTTIGEVLGDRLDDLHHGYRDVTVEQLLAHVGGLSTSPPNGAWSKAWSNQGRIPATEQRLAFVTALLKDKPAYQPGTKTEYSNQGYAVLGVMLETLLDKAWEDLIRERIFVPLEMHSAGFRAPCSEGRLDQPWGHAKNKPVPPEPKGDNPDAIGPAGTIHASLGDWAKFARFHLRRQPGLILQKQESFEKLHSTLPRSKNHGVGGWLVQDMKAYGGHAIQMTGSNTMWFSLLWIFPERNTAIVVATNTGQPNAFTACDEAVVALFRAYAAK